MSEIGQEADKVLRKYVGVWLWSILFGGNSALWYSTIMLGRYAEYSNMAKLTFTVVIGVAIISVVISYLYLLRYLSTYLLPTFFKNSSAEIDDAERLESARMLRSAATYTVMSIGLASLAGFLMVALG